MYMRNLFFRKHVNPFFGIFHAYFLPEGKCNKNI